MEKSIYPCLWFNHNAKEAAEYYCSIFKDSKILDSSLMVTTFELNKTKFMALNGGSQHPFTPATSFVVECETQDIIDYYWEKLGEGGEYNRCGWLKDKFGVSWQIVPTVLSKLMSDPEKGKRVVDAFLKMQKFDIATLEKA